MTSEITSCVTGNLGHITLHRPKALNALTLAMCEEITRLLVEWEADPNIGAVLVTLVGSSSGIFTGSLMNCSETSMSEPITS